MVLVPEVVKAVSPTPVLVAGGIGTGAEIAASLALGAQGVWMGSLWLATAESNSSPEGTSGSMDATSSADRAVTLVHREARPNAGQCVD